MIIDDQDSQTLLNHGNLLLSIPIGAAKTASIVIAQASDCLTELQAYRISHQISPSAQTPYDKEANLGRRDTICLQTGRGC